MVTSSFNKFVENLKFICQLINLFVYRNQIHTFFDKRLITTVIVNVFWVSCEDWIIYFVILCERKLNIFFLLAVVEYTSDKNSLNVWERKTKKSSGKPLLSSCCHFLCSNPTSHCSWNKLIATRTKSVNRLFFFLSSSLGIVTWIRQINLKGT